MVIFTYQAPNSQTLVIVGDEIRMLWLYFAQQMRRKNAEVPDIYFTLSDAAGLSPTLVSKQNAKTKEREAGSLSKSERLKLEGLYTQGGAAYGFPCNLVKAGNLPLSKVKQFLQSSTSYTKFILTTWKFRRIEAFDSFKN